MNKALAIKDGIYWAGALDYDIRTFDIIMRTEYGTSYNSYVIKGQNKTAIVEIVKETFFDEYLERLNDVCDTSKIDYIIADHAEPDHSGALVYLLKKSPNAKVVGTQATIKFLKEITNMEFAAHPVKDGDTLDLGGKTFKFMTVPFLHWPDTMYTYCPEENVIFTCDSFGCHYCSDKVFNDAIEGDFLDAYKYYFDCIMGPFKSYVLDALDKIKDLEIDVVCPGHGPVLRKDIKKYLDLYLKWSTPVIPKKPSVFIPYVTSYGYTKRLAERIAEGVQNAADIDVAVINIGEEEFDAVMEKAAAADGILIGSPTLVGDTLPPIWKLLSELNPVIHRGKLAGAFGSYGWSGEAVGNIEDRFKQLKFKMPLPGLKILFNPSEAQLQTAFDFGKDFGLEVDKAFKAKYNN